jgi:FixJ family two-component response regulator
LTINTAWEHGTDLVERARNRSGSKLIGALHLRFEARGALLPARKSVFVVDDDPSMRSSIERLLRVHGLNTRLFASADALIQHDDFSEALCIVLDIDLNGQSGIDLRQHLADTQNGLPVIFITGRDSEANRALATKSGCAAYLTKPFAAQSLIEPIEKLRAEAS